MREPPKLANPTIQAALQEHYGISGADLAFLPIGNDSASFVYRVESPDGTSYFLKVRAGKGFSAPSLMIPHFLAGQGIARIGAPLPTLSSALWVAVGDFTLSLYPFIEACTAAEVGLAEQHWQELGATLRQIHTCDLPPHLRQIVPRETFVPSRRRVLSDLESLLASQDVADPIQRELAEFWRSRREQIHSLIEHADALGKQLRGESLPLVLCHADLHTWNVLLDARQQSWIVDWDEVVLAPKERDLMFVVGGIGRDLVRPHETTRFLQGYGDPAIDYRALVYYRYAWAVQDIAAYAEDVFFLPGLGEESRRAALHGFIDLFGPGNIVAIAREADGSLPELRGELALPANRRD